MSEFSDRTFVAGTIVGLRAFSVDSLGRLTGVIAPQVWMPGENLAECRREEVDTATGARLPPWSSFVFGPSTQFTLTADPTTSTVPPIPAPTGPLTPTPCKDHALVSLSCKCGFYAYFDGGNDYATKATTGISGVVEGYGRVVAGTRGFRAEKARVLALVEPKLDGLAAEKSWERVAHNYPVPTFASVRKVLAEFPLSDPIITPESADDFWTRSVS